MASSITGPSKPTLHNHPHYAWLRGFNIVPSWAARIEQAWWNYDPDAFRAEIALAAQVHSNCIRLWMEFSAWMADPNGVQAAFLDAVSAIDSLGMKTMPCLFNRWHDRDYDYGGTSNEDLHHNLDPKLEYVRALVLPLATDDRILLWDLCNEPSTCRLDDPIAAWEIHWLSRVADTVRAVGARQPITIGTHQSGKNMDIFAPLCDVLCCHPYGRTPEELALMLTVCKQVQQRHGKPMLSNETIPGCLDDLKRAECARWTIPMMEDAGYGWMGWGLKEGKTVSTRRDRHDTNGIDGEGFHAWFTADGILRHGLEFLRDQPRFSSPWMADT
ncbi:MAG: cellulase family glycosylhydrolase [Chthoniobacterales bacterium]|nr:cellulase family glycosylhydrolase [Chthoniobacterales bacterium]